MRRLRTAVALICACVAVSSVLAACGGSDEPAGDPDQGKNAVRITGFLFKPERLAVAAGATVTWTNSDDIAHTITAGTPEMPTGAFDSGDVTKGQTFSHTFSDAGPFTYFCNNHKSMRGEVDVT